MNKAWQYYALIVAVVLCLGASRDSRWTSVRNKIVADNPYCAVCGYTNNLEVHHIVPFSHNPALELDTNNFIVLCRKYGCHLRFGHFGNYKQANTNLLAIIGDIGKRMNKAEQEYKSSFTNEIK